MGLHNRPGHQMRKEGHKKGKVGEFVGWRKLATIYVDRVAHGLESVERDSDGQDDIKMEKSRVQIEPSDDHLQVVDEEIEILKESQD